MVKLFRTMFPGELVKVLENCIQSIIETEISSILGAETYKRMEGRTNYRKANWVTLVSELLSNFQLDSQEPKQIYNKEETLLEAR